MGVILLENKKLPLFLPFFPVQIAKGENNCKIAGFANFPRGRLFREGFAFLLPCRGFRCPMRFPLIYIPIKNNSGRYEKKIK